MNFKNFGINHYYPPKYLTENLEKLLIFTENNTKKDIPNGSVFVYKSKEYKPQILAGDIGCGITAVITEKMNFSKAINKDILGVVNSMNTHIGQGNHFLDFTTGHQGISRLGMDNTMIFLHSDFNNENIVPTTYSEAKDLENRAKDLRIDFLEKLTNRLGISSKLYQNWTHNSVNLQDDLMTYRKGAINLTETEGIGALALNPLDGIFLYAGDFNDYEHSAQHGVGRIGSKGELLRILDKQVEGIARGYSIESSRVNPIVNQIRDKTYNSMDLFREKFSGEYSPISVCRPELVVTTKKSRGN